MVPLFVAFKTDRLFFLINFISYLLLPGLVFSVFSHLGISKRVCWWWMWVFPCGYCYILQAGSVGNDSFAAVYLLASLHYLYQTKDSPSFKSLTLSTLAIALVTGAKASNIPLVLPWLVLLFFHRKYLFEKFRPVTTALVLISAAAISFLPMGLLNIHYTGDFFGDPYNKKLMKVSNPVSGLLGNSLQLATVNLAPPLFPYSVDWEPVLPSSLKAKLLRDFPLLQIRSGELQIEEEAGLGLGSVLLLAAFIMVGAMARGAGQSLCVARNSHASWIVCAGAVAWLAYMTKLGNPETSRLIAPYYPLLVGGILVLVSLDGRVMHCRAFRWGGIGAMLTAIPLLILNPARPIFPVQVVYNILATSHLPGEIVTRYHDVYGVYALRSDVFKELRTSIPLSEETIGLVQNNSAPEASLWRPWGKRTVIEVMPVDSIQQIKARGIHFVVVSQEALSHPYHTTLGSLLAKWSASLVEEENLTILVQNGPQKWYLIKL